MVRETFMKINRIPLHVLLVRCKPTIILSIAPKIKMIIFPRHHDVRDKKKCRWGIRRLIPKKPSQMPEMQTEPNPNKRVDQVDKTTNVDSTNSVSIKYGEMEKTCTWLGYYICSIRKRSIFPIGDTQQLFCYYIFIVHTRRSWSSRETPADCSNCNCSLIWFFFRRN